MQRRFFRELAAAGLPPGPGPGEPVTDADLANLPEPARRYLRFMRVVGRPRDWSMRFAFDGLFRPYVDQPWRKCRAWQYNSRLEVARIFHIVIRFGGVMPVLGRDTYLDGKGRMLIKAFDWFTIADGVGDEYDIGELVTYLNDMVLAAPSMLLAPDVTFTAVDNDAFDLTLVNRGIRVSARVTLAEDGSPIDFSTTDRFCADPRNPKRLLRTLWTTPVAEWKVIQGRPLPARVEAIWHLPRGEFPYARFELIPGSVAFNVAPGA